MEITDAKIFKIALFTSLFGIIGMLIFAGWIEPKEIAIEEINRGMVEEKVAISGVIQDIKPSSSGKSYFMTLHDGTGKISVVVFEATIIEFNEAGVDINSFKNKKVKVMGTLTQYNQEMELILENSNSITIET
ncbi:MAG: RNA-binding protein [Methanobrevibacter sp.]|jgi:DNA/RNA endonuclease YhcR with UshA esterase domain|nr:RNA-binding protein [Methanobrevibacter sp.]